MLHCGNYIFRMSSSVGFLHQTREPPSMLNVQDSQHIQYMGVVKSKTVALSVCYNIAI